MGKKEMGNNVQYTYELTVLTPTYNRGSFLHILYESLCKQTCKVFQWLIIDDGSTDETKQVVDSFTNQGFEIDYYRKQNGGKHTALNYAHPYIKGELVCIVDSDDWLLPEAVDRILESKKQYFTVERVKLLTFLRGKSPKESVCRTFPEMPEISNHIDFRVNGKRSGDCCEVISTDVLKEFPFPEHPGEKFLGEGYLWNNAGFKYDTVYIPEIIYICEYLEGGLTKSGRKLRIKCPLGGMDNSNSFFGSGEGRIVNNKTLSKEAMLYVCYGKFAGLGFGEIISRCERQDLVRKNYLQGCFLYVYWKWKYDRHGGN